MVDQSRRILTAYPTEIIFQMNIAREHLFHSSVQPRAGALRLSGSPNKDTVSNGTARSDRNVGSGIDPIANVGARMWSAGVEEVDDLYGEPIGDEFTNPPISTVCVLKFNEESDRQLSVEAFGQKFENRANVIIPVIHHLENDYPAPKEGDMMEFWAESWQEFGIFYNVTKVNRAGFINGTSYHTEWKLEITRNEEYVPARRLLGKSIHNQ